MLRSRLALAPLVVAFAALQHGAASAATPQVYQYRIEHPKYGDIGTYTNTIEQNGDSTDVRTDVQVAVRFLGLVLFRQEATRLEHWQKDRLVSFTGTTVTNGDKIEVHGEARGAEFVVATPAGTFTAPANVHPSNPWSPQVLDTDVMMSTKTGKVTNVRVIAQGEEPITFDGVAMRLQRYEIISDKDQLVWLDEHGVTIAMRSPENGVAVDFVLEPNTPQTAAR